MSLDTFDTPRRPVPFDAADLLSQLNVRLPVRPPRPSAFEIARESWVTYFARYDPPHRAHLHSSRVLSAPRLRSHPKVSIEAHQIWRDGLAGAQDAHTIHARLDSINCGVSANGRLEEMVEEVVFLVAEAEIFRHGHSAFMRQQANPGGAIDPIRANWASSHLTESASRLDEVVDLEKRIAPTVSHRLQVAYVHARYALDRLPECPAKRENREDLCFCIAISRHLLEDALERPPYMCVSTRFSVLRKYLYTLQRELSQIDPKLSSPRTLLRDYTAPPLANGPETFKAGELMAYVGWHDV